MQIKKRNNQYKYNKEYFFHNNDYPNNQSPYWGDDDALTNGITHDDDSWIITALGTNRIGQSNDDWIIRKIPFFLAGVLSPDIPELILS